MDPESSPIISEFDCTGDTTMAFRDAENASFIMNSSNVTSIDLELDSSTIIEQDDDAEIDDQHENVSIMDAQHENELVVDQSNIGCSRNEHSIMDNSNEFAVDDHIDTTDDYVDEEERSNSNENWGNDICSPLESDSDYSDDSDYDYIENSDYEYSGNDSEFVEINTQFEKLNRLLNEDHWNDNVDANFVVNRIELFYSILSFSAQHSLSSSSTIDLCKMFNSFFSKKLIPESQYRIDKLFYPRESITYHAVCPQCEKYLNTFKASDKTKNCDTCDIDINLKSPLYRDYFATFDVKTEIINVIENNEYFYKKVISGVIDDDMSFNDLYDGRLYKNFKRSLPADQKNAYATLTFNSDGSPVFKSSQGSVWPIQACVNEVDFKTRSKKPIVFGMWFGKDKPSMTNFLEPFVAYINSLSELGIRCNFADEEVNIHVYALCCCVDSVARAPMQGLTQFNGRYGCNWCLHPGQLVGEGRSAVIKYPLLHFVPPRRVEFDSLMQINEAVNSQRTVFGFKNASPLINLQKFNIVDGFVPDGMHCIFLGVAKQFYNYWFNNPGNNFSLSPDEKASINELLQSIRIPKHLARACRIIKSVRFWKSKEWENWLLFYSHPILSAIQRMNSFSVHWLKLVDSVYFLMQDTISINELTRANELLKEFVAQIEDLYFPEAMTYNVHQLLHLPQSGSDWGPLYAHSGYAFESGNGQIIRMVHAEKVLSIR
ncbi:hypothetical protein TKK_0015374 [Trichogramma kaykai]|uniref:Transposase domain-containing protein n=1 Tax=Trichogramma kaykai TaxID=54128 RepID=A0ABD2WA89_9HYME